MSSSFSPARLVTALFTVIVQHRGAKAQAQPVAEHGAATALAMTWSKASPGDVQIYRSGDFDPLCTYRAGERIACRCPDAVRSNDASGMTP